jgi:hypothetical protein
VRGGRGAVYAVTKWIMQPRPRVLDRCGQILFIQGGGADVHDAWDDKLVASLKR